MTTRNEGEMPRLTTIGAFKWLSAEMLGTAVFGLLVAGGIWANLNNSVAEAQEEAKEATVKLQELASNVQAIQVDLAVIKAMSAAAAAAASARDQEQSRQIERVLDLLDKNGAPQ
jgi:hypothetical protein